MAGHPKPDITIPVMHTLVEAGADIIELGVPFSDPMADGPVIQKAGEAALAQGMTLPKVLDMVRGFREQDQNTPVVIMGYLNPIEAMGYEKFTRHAAEAGVDGILTVDMPPEEAGDFTVMLKAAAIDPIFLLAPTSSRERIQRVTAAASGYVYYVSLKGTTGSATLNVASVEEKLLTIRELTDLPIGVGFGIRDAASAAAIARVADAAVVGTVLVALMTKHADDINQMQKSLSGLISSMRQAMDEVQ
jgi:tryptophan synthase alpha chain